MFLRLALSLVRMHAATCCSRVVPRDVSFPWQKVCKFEKKLKEKQGGDNAVIKPKHNAPFRFVRMCNVCMSGKIPWYREQVMRWPHEVATFKQR